MSKKIARGSLCVLGMACLLPRRPQSRSTSLDKP